MPTIISESESVDADMMLVMHGFIFSVHTLKDPQIVTIIVLLVLRLVLSRHAVSILVSIDMQLLLYLSFV